MRPPRLLFVEDDDSFRGVLCRELEAFGYEVLAYASAEEALAAGLAVEPEIALLDLGLPGIDGITLMERLKERIPELTITFLTGHGAVPDAVRAMRAGAFDFLIKPTRLDELEITLQRAVEHTRLRQDNQRLRQLVDRDATSELIGESAAMHELRRSIERLGQSEANVLIYGENGTGKELVARGIHAASPRRDRPFVAVNCGAIPSELFEAELFGHRRGAFTGASSERQGLVALASGGTLFLDEIGELPLHLQPAMLRFAQFGEYRPVGSEQLAHAEVRLVAASNRDLSRVSAGEFREDLYHRISTLGVVVPPLRDRGEDVVQLAQHFLARANQSLPAAEAHRLQPDALEALRQHRWSGNVRELENLIVLLVTLSDPPAISAEHVRRHLQPIGEAPAEASAETLDLQSLERAAVVRAMRLHQGRRERAAAELGVAVKTLYNKLRHHGIDAAEWASEPS